MGDMKMPKNLVIIPMEGVSQLHFWNYREAMPTLWQMSERAVMFKRFYSTSTSAFQSFCDFAHGDSSELDHNFSYPSAKGCLLGQARNFFSIMRENGYSVLGLQHGETRPPYIKDNFLGAWPDNCGEFEWHDRYDPFFNRAHKHIEESKNAGNPFLLYISDRASTVADNCMEKQDARLLHERFAKGYTLLDCTVRAVMEKLAQLTLLDDTIVVAFGPYGMDPWKHGLFGGRTKSIAPYADVCWTPLFLYNNNRDAKLVDNLVCSIDLKPTLLGLLFPGQAQDGRGGVFSGVNVLEKVRDVVFTQNLFALERENEGPARGITKSYGVTDGDQRLVVSSSGGIAGEGGMEFYYDPRDATNSRNLLDFFKLDKDGKLTSFGHPRAIHPHFALAWQAHQPERLIQSVVESYNAMRDVLKRLVLTKEEKALPHCSNPGEAMLFDEKMFLGKRKR